jgi:hypothetical protein
MSSVNNVVMFSNKDEGFCMYDKSLDRNGKMVRNKSNLTDGDCVIKCCDCLWYYGNKYGWENFSLGCFVGDISALDVSQTSASGLGEKEKRIMMKSGKPMVHFYLINKKLNKVIDRSQSTIKFVDTDKWHRSRRDHYRGRCMIYGTPMDAVYKKCKGQYGCFKYYHLYILINMIHQDPWQYPYLNDMFFGLNKKGMDKLVRHSHIYFMDTDAFTGRGDKLLSGEIKL